MVFFCLRFVVGSNYDPSIIKLCFYPPENGINGVMITKTAPAILFIDTVKTVAHYYIKQYNT